MIRSHPECGVIITGDFNQLQDNFLRTHYRFVQVVEVVTRGQATLDKIWTKKIVGASRTRAPTHAQPCIHIHTRIHSHVRLLNTYYEAKWGLRSSA